MTSRRSAPERIAGSLANSSSTDCCTQTRINQDHGLFRDIVRNQISRDEYHKMQCEQKSAKNRSATTVSQSCDGDFRGGSGIPNQPGGNSRSSRGGRRAKKNLGDREYYVPPNKRNNEKCNDATSLKTSSTTCNSPPADIPNQQQQSTVVTELAGDNSETRVAIRKRLKNEAARAAATAKAAALTSSRRVSDGDEQSASKNAIGHDEPLFRLDLVGADGQLSVRQVVHANDSPARLAKAITVAHSLSDVQCRALRKLLDEELAKRLTQLEI